MNVWKIIAMVWLALVLTGGVGYLMQWGMGPMRGNDNGPPRYPRPAPPRSQMVRRGA